MSKKLKIVVHYNIGSKSHREEFAAYDLFGKWIAKELSNINTVNIKVHEE